MSYVHPYSKRCEKSEIDLFSVPPTQLSLEKGRWIDYRPLSSVENDDSAITFLISGTDEYIDLSKTILVVQGNVKNGDGSNLSGGTQTNVAPVNNFLHSLIKQVDVYLNGKQVTPAMGTYAYRSYIETLLNYDVSAKNSQLSSALYFKDTPGEMDSNGSLLRTRTITYNKAPTGSNSSFTFESGASKGYKDGRNSNFDFDDDISTDIVSPGTGNQGFAKRHEFIKDSKTFVLSGPIFSDVFMGDRLLLNMLDLKVVLNRSSNAFCLMDTNTGSNKVNSKVKLTDVVLKIRKVKVDQSVSDATELILKQTPALYPIRRVECKALSIPSGLPSVRKDNVFSGIIPKSFVFGLVDANSYSGENNKNPYNFHHFKVKTITLSVNGEEIPFKQLVLDYTSATAKDFIQAYTTLFSGTGKMYANTGLDITREDYAGGYALYAFDLTPDMCNTTDYFNAVQRGSLSVDITFDEQTTVPINMVCYGDFENIICIDSERNVVYDIS